jgi:hypothetical protein
MISTDSDEDKSPIEPKLSLKMIVKSEIDAMSKIADILYDLDQETTNRVIEWADDLFVKTTFNVSSKETFTENIKRVVNTFGNQEFKVVDIENKLKKEGKIKKGEDKKARISSVALTLANEKLIKIIQKGSGRMPSIYKLK